MNTQWQQKQIVPPHIYLPILFLLISFATFTTQAQQAVTRNDYWTPVEQEFSGIAFVQVPAGCFMMGGLNVFPDMPLHSQCLDEPFWISKTEITQADFERLDGTKASPNTYRGDDKPVDSITWFEAQAFCESIGGYLPTEAEWEYAARGPESLIYPWGNEYNVSLVIGEDNPTYGYSSTAPVGSKPAGASWVGALDMSGNVSEWTLSEYKDYPYVANDGRNGLQDRSGYRVFRGGSFKDDRIFLASPLRGADSPNLVSDSFGFRCALTATRTSTLPAMPATSGTPRAHISNQTWLYDLPEGDRIRSINNRTLALLGQSSDGLWFLVEIGVEKLWLTDNQNLTLEGDLRSLPTFQVAVVTGNTRLWSAPNAQAASVIIDIPANQSVIIIGQPVNGYIRLDNTTRDDWYPVLWWNGQTSLEGWIWQGRLRR